LSAQAYQTALAALYEFLAPLVQNIDAGARRWFRFHCYTAPGAVMIAHSILI
jgi:hypothetical protein